MKKINEKLIPLMMASFVLSTPALADVEEDLRRLEQEIKDIRQQTNTLKPSDIKLNIYGTFRPVLTVEDDGTDSATDVRDSSSRFGLSGSTPILESSKAFFRGEWKVRFGNEGQIDGTSAGGRHAFVGIEGELGRVAIGKQRPPQYTLIGEPVDIFNHASSPYAYDNVTPFFVDNVTTYQYKKKGFDFQAAVRTDGASGKDHDDLVNVGLGFSANNMTAAVAYLKATSPSIGVDGPDEEGAEMENMALALSATLDKLYLAAAYQAITKTPEVGNDVDVTTLDVSAAYTLPKRYKVKAGVFVYDDGIDGATSMKNQGMNITIERQLADNVRIHGEYLIKDFDEGDALSALSVGFRYNFDADL